MTEVEQIIDAAIQELARNPHLDYFDKATLCTRLQEKFRAAYNVFMDQWEHDLERREQERNTAA